MRKRLVLCNSAHDEKFFSILPKNSSPSSIATHQHGKRTQFTFIFSHSLRIIIIVEWWRVCWKNTWRVRESKAKGVLNNPSWGDGWHGIVSKHTSVYVFLFIFYSTNILYVYTIEGLLRWRRNQAAKKVSTKARKIYYLKNALCVWELWFHKSFFLLRTWLDELPGYFK